MLVEGAGIDDDAVQGDLMGPIHNRGKFWRFITGFFCSYLGLFVLVILYTLAGT